MIVAVLVLALLQVLAVAVAVVVAGGVVVGGGGRAGGAGEEAVVVVVVATITRKVLTWRITAVTSNLLFWATGALGTVSTNPKPKPLQLQRSSRMRTETPVNQTLPRLSSAPGALSGVEGAAGGVGKALGHQDRKKASVIQTTRNIGIEHE